MARGRYLVLMDLRVGVGLFHDEVGLLLSIIGAKLASWDVLMCFDHNYNNINTQKLHLQKGPDRGKAISEILKPRFQEMKVSQFWSKKKKRQTWN